MIDSLELFVGAGGLAMGMQRAGFDHRAVIEWDQNSCDNLRGNIRDGFAPMENWEVIQADVRTVDYTQFLPGIQLIGGGPPCQPFSLGGNHQAYNDKRDMFPEAVRAVRNIKPKAFVFENVRGLMRKSFASYFSYIILQLTFPETVKKQNETWLEHLGRLEKQQTSGHYTGIRYNVVSRLLNAADYGVPQLRHRVVIVGFREDLGVEWSFPDGEHNREKLLYTQWVSGEYWDTHRVAKKNRPTLNSADKRRVERMKRDYTTTEMPGNPWKTVRDAIGDLPNPKSKKASQFNSHIFRDGARSYPGHTGSALDEPSKTIKAGVHGVPGGENTVVLDDGSIRYYTVRESARIQTFPDDYHFYGSWTESTRQIGNAVPVDLAYLVGKSVIEGLEEVEGEL